MTPRDDLRAALDEETKHYGPPSKANAWTVEAIAVHRAAERVLAEPSAAEVLTRLRDWIVSNCNKMSPLNDDAYSRGVGVGARAIVQEIEAMHNGLDKQPPEAPKPESDPEAWRRSRGVLKPQAEPPAEREPHDCGYVGCGAEDARRFREERDALETETEEVAQALERIEPLTDGIGVATHKLVSRLKEAAAERDALHAALAEVCGSLDAHERAVGEARKMLKEAT